MVMKRRVIRKRVMKKRPGKHLQKKVVKKGGYVKYKNPHPLQTLNYMKKIMKSQSLNVYYGFREANELHDGTGKVSLLNDQTTGTELPLHIYNLNSIINDGTTGAAGWKLHSNGYDFTSLGGVEGMGVTGQNHLSITNVSAAGKNMLYNNYNDIRLLLWGKTNRKAVYRVMLLQLTDEELDPSQNVTTTDTNTQEKRQLLYGTKLLRPTMLNPVISEIHTKVLNKGYKILWNKVYTIKEQLSTEDQRPHKLIKIHRPRNKLIRYQEGPVITLDVASADTVAQHIASTPPTQYPTSSHDSLFLVIVGNNSDEDEALTYDINLKNKYTMLGNV